MDPAFNGYPAIVGVHPDGDTTWVTIRVIVSSRDLRTQLSGWVVEHDHDLHTAHVRILPWPLIALRVTVEQRFHTGPLATKLTGQLNGDQDTVDVDIPFSAAAYALMKADPANVSFRIEYSYENVRDSYATASQSLATEVNAALANAIQAAQLTTDQVITQEERDGLISRISTSINKSVTGNNVDLAKQLLNAANSDSLLNAYLPAKTVEFSGLADEDLKKKLYDHLAPLIQSAHQQWTQSHSETDTTGVKVNVGLKAGPLTISPEASDQIQKQTGITFQKDDSTQVSLPFKAKVYTVRSVTQATTLNYAQTVVIAEGGSSDFADDGPTPITFTGDKLDFNLKQSAAAPFDGVTPGMAFCYLGKDIPDGFFELDGRASWPDANWVPDALRGTKTVAAQGALVGVASSAAQVGNISAAGSLPLPLPPIVSTEAARFSPNESYMERTDKAYPGLPGAAGDNPFSPLAWRFRPGDGDWTKYHGNVTWDGWAVYRVGHYNGYAGDRLAQLYNFDATRFYALSNDQVPKTLFMTSAANPPNLQCRWIVRR